MSKMVTLSFASSPEAPCSVPDPFWAQGAERSPRWSLSLGRDQTEGSILYASCRDVQSAGSPGTKGCQLAGLVGKSSWRRGQALKCFCNQGHIFKAQQPWGTRLASVTGSEGRKQWPLPHGNPGPIPGLKLCLCLQRVYCLLGEHLHWKDL